MQLPEYIQNEIEKIFEKADRKALREARASLREDYQKGAVSPFENEAKRLAYLGARMPATYAACYRVLSQVNVSGHVLDLGAGPGTASFALLELYPEIEKITLIERSSSAIELGKRLSQNHPKMEWVHQTLNDPLIKADCAVLSYVLGELVDPIKVIESSLDAAPLLILIEPGTPRGFGLILEARRKLLELGMHLIGPCPHKEACPIQKNDWCHFSTRIERSRLHRDLKEASLGYEDEKFSYLIVSKTPHCNQGDRIIRRPIRSAGHIQMTLCTEAGKIEEKTISKKTKELYRKAKKCDWGDSFSPD